MSALLLVAQAGMAINLGQLVIVLIVIGAIWYIFNAVVALPATAKLIVNVVLVAILAILAVKVLLSFV